MYTIKNRHEGFLKIFFVSPGTISLEKSFDRQNPVVVVVQFLSCVWLFVNPCTAACQASLSFTMSWSLLQLMSIESMMPFKHSSSVTPFSFFPQSFPASRSFPVSWLFISDANNSSCWVSTVSKVFFCLFPPKGLVNGSQCLVWRLSLQEFKPLESNGTFTWWPVCHLLLFQGEWVCHFVNLFTGHLLSVNPAQRWFTGEFWKIENQSLCPGKA